MSNRGEPCSLGNAKCISTTAKAILVELHDMDDEEKWIPQSVVHADSEVWRKGDEGKLVMQEWWARKENLE